MATLLDYLIPQTMKHVRSVDDIDRQRAIQTLEAFAKQPDLFQGVQAGPPPAEVMAAYQKATGTQWPMAQNQQTGAPPPGVGRSDSFLSNNLPAETLAVMRSPLSQVSNEMGQKAVAETLAKIKARETGLENEGDLATREFQKKAQMIPGQMETLGGILKPYGYDQADIAAQVTGKYPGERAAELKRKEHYPPRDPSVKLYATEEGWMPADMAIGKQRPPTGGGAKGAAMPPQVKAAQDLVKRLTPVVTGSVSPMVALLSGMIPEAQSNPALAKALQGGQLPPELKALYDQSVQILNAYYGVPAQGAATTENPNDPLGIR